MRIDITQKHENKLFGRQEAQFVVKEATTTPSRKELREKIAALIGADEKNLVVDVYNTSYGTTEVSGVCRVYKNESDLRKTELKPIIERNFGRPEKAKPAEEAPAPVPKK
ncbi:MAG TPA: hypothetical protein VJG83_01025 [archaeon]|nr:hypothetical protein [archaeon]